MTQDWFGVRPVSQQERDYKEELRNIHDDLYFMVHSDYPMVSRPSLCRKELVRICDYIINIIKE